MLKNILTLKKCYLCNNTCFLQGKKEYITCPSCKMNISASLCSNIDNFKDNVLSNLKDKEEKLTYVKKDQIEKTDNFTNIDLIYKISTIELGNNVLIPPVEEDTDSGYDSDCDTSDEEAKYNIDDYVVKSYEKDLEMAINMSLKDQEFCIICYDKPINTVFVPCGHMSCCYKCGKKCESKCPICRKKIKTVQKIYC